jgi:predicted RNA binding protein YcfA (HicA-like mRNA interferase family)
MPDKRKFLQRILNNRKNVSFNEFVSLAEGFGFFLDRTSGSHHIYKNTRIKEIINLQNDKGEAKPYQIKQFLNIVEKYRLELED